MILRLLFLKWMLKKPKVTTFVGCIGVDKYGEILQEKAEEIGVQTAYYKQAEEKTGLCAALICGKHRYKSNLHYSRDITPKRVTSGGIHLSGLAPGQHSSDETFPRWRHCPI